MRKKRKIIHLFMVAIVGVGWWLGSVNVFANEQYPTSDSVTDANGITMINEASWMDETHTDGNYNANLEISINGLKDTKSFNEPIDVQIVQDISTSMDEVCYNPSHVNFQYYKKITDAFTAEQINTEYKPLIENALNGILPDENSVTGKDSWIPISGMQDKEGKIFSDDAFLVPVCSFQLKVIWNPSDPSGTLTPQIYPTNFLDFYEVIDNPVLSMDDSGLGSGQAYYYKKYHASLDENGTYHALRVVEDPITPQYVHFGYFDKAVAIYKGCKSYTTTAYNLLSEFGEKLYAANTDSHLSINSFSEINQYTSSFSNDLDDLKQNLIEAFNKKSGSTNYEAGLVNGRDSLYSHTDGDDRRKFLIFISDGSPNKSLDDDGNVVDSSNMKRLVNISDAMKVQGVEIYTVGFCVDEYVNNTFLLPMATSGKHSHFRTPGQLDMMVEVYDLIREQVVEDTYIKSTVEDTISQYYTVDKDKLPPEISLIESEETTEDGSTILVQKIRYDVRTEDLDEQGVNKKSIPLILKEEYRNTNEYYPTNDETRNGVNAIYENLDAIKQNVAVKTPWLPVNIKEETAKFVIDTEVVNGTISEKMVDIPSGESRTITYAPKEGCQLKEIIVDGAKIILEGNESEYLFEEIMENHTIKVVYEEIIVEPIKKFMIDTEVVNGTISERMVDIPSGENRKITYAPKEGYQLKEIIVDGAKIKLEGNESEYLFERIEGNHTIKVIYEEIAVEPIGKFVIDTEVVNGTISERMVDIPLGENRKITYAPKEGYQLKDIIVDGAKIKSEGNESEYTFEGIVKDHIIKVVYEKENHRDNEMTDKPVNGDNNKKNNNNDVKGGISSNPLKANLVKTGDETALIMFAVAAGLALLVIGTILLLRRHHNIDKKIR